MKKHRYGEPVGEEPDQTTDGEDADQALEGQDVAADGQYGRRKIPYERRNEGDAESPRDQLQNGKQLRIAADEFRRLGRRSRGFVPLRQVPARVAADEVAQLPRAGSRSLARFRERVHRLRSDGLGS